MEMHAKASLRSRSTAATTGAEQKQVDEVSSLSLSATPVLDSWVWPVYGIWVYGIWYTYKLRYMVSGHRRPASCVLRPAGLQDAAWILLFIQFVPREVEYGVTLTLAAAIIHLSPDILHPPSYMTSHGPVNFHILRISYLLRVLMLSLSLLHTRYETHLQILSH